MQNSDFFVLKHAITKKLYQLFSETKIKLAQSALHSTFPFAGEVDVVTGKISKGENYQLLPYLILDYPRHFSREGVFAFRWMFWWGNYFIFTFHVSGKYLKQIDQGQQVQQLKQQKSLWVSTGKSEWHHAVERPYYLPTSEFEAWPQQSFFKLAKTVPLDDWEKVPEKALHFYEMILRTLYD